MVIVPKSSLIRSPPKYRLESCRLLRSEKPPDDTAMALFSDVAWRAKNARLHFVLKVQIGDNCLQGTMHALHLMYKRRY